MLESSDDELILEVLQKLAVLLRETEVRNIIETAAAFARLNVGDLLEYAGRSGYYIGSAKETEPLNGPF